MKTFRRIVSLVPLLVLWLMFSIILWGFVFNLITDAPPAQKIALYADAETPGATQLAVILEEKLNGKVRMVKVRSFDYAMFDTGALTAADLYIVPASHAETYLEWFALVPQEMREESGLMTFAGVPYGILAYDADTGKGIAADCIRYAVQDGEREDYYLFFGKRSLHLPDSENAVDAAAVDAARCLLNLYK